jgi:hypothetical protein
MSDLLGPIDDLADFQLGRAQGRESYRIAPEKRSRRVEASLSDARIDRKQDGDAHWQAPR